MSLIDDINKIAAANPVGRIGVEGPAVQMRVLHEILVERDAQDKKWGEQNHRDGTGATYYQREAFVYRKACESAFASKLGTWRHIFCEEAFEALAEVDPAKIRHELIQVAAVCVAWIEAIDRRAKPE